jgi:hypothetical protein
MFGNQVLVCGSLQALPNMSIRKLVGAVGIEIIMLQNLKEFCGMGCSRKSFAVLGRNYCCPRIAPAFS